MVADRVVASAHDALIAHRRREAREPPVLAGAATQAEHRKVLWEVLRRTLGRFALADEVTVERPDAGAP